MTSHSKENMAYYSLLRWKMIIIQILAISLMHFLFKRLGEWTFWAQEWKGSYPLFIPPPESRLCWAPGAAGEPEDHVPHGGHDGPGPADHHPRQACRLRLRQEHPAGGKVFHAVQTLRGTAHQTGTARASHPALGMEKDLAGVVHRKTFWDLGYYKSLWAIRCQATIEKTLQRVGR